DIGHAAVSLQIIGQLRLGVPSLVRVSPPVRCRPDRHCSYCAAAGAALRIPLSSLGLIVGTAVGADGGDAKWISIWEPNRPSVQYFSLPRFSANSTLLTSYESSRWLGYRVVRALGWESNRCSTRSAPCATPPVAAYP